MFGIFDLGAPPTASAARLFAAAAGVEKDADIGGGGTSSSCGLVVSGSDDSSALVAFSFPVGIPPESLTFLLRMSCGLVGSLCCLPLSRRRGGEEPVSVRCAPTFLTDKDDDAATSRGANGLCWGPWLIYEELMHWYNNAIRD